MSVDMLWLATKNAGAKKHHLLNNNVAATRMTF